MNRRHLGIKQDRHNQQGRVVGDVIMLGALIIVLSVVFLFFFFQMSYLLQAEQYFEHQAMVFQNASKYEVVYKVVVFILNENVFIFL